MNVPATHTGSRPAVFLDRDGTLIEDVPYLSDPAHLRLVPGASAALRRLREAGFACVLVTNQSAIGRGLFSEERLAEIHEALHRLLDSEGAALDAIYYCVVAPAVDNPDPRLVEHPDRKPGPGMLLRAAEALGLDLAASWMVGDSLSDIVAGWNAGCRGSILVRTGRGRAAEAIAPSDIVFEPVDSLVEAVELVLANTTVGAADPTRLDSEA